VDTWHAYLGEPTLADAILDRIVHHSHRIELKTKGESLRESLPLTDRGQTQNVALKLAPTTEKPSCYQPIVDTEKNRRRTRRLRGTVHDGLESLTTIDGILRQDVHGFTPCRSSAREAGRGGLSLKCDHSSMVGTIECLERRSRSTPLDWVPPFLHFAPGWI